MLFGILSASSSATIADALTNLTSVVTWVFKQIMDNPILLTCFIVSLVGACIGLVFRLRRG